MKAVVFLMILTGLNIQPSRAGGGSHGGDTQLIEKAAIQLFIKNELKNKIKDTLTWIISQPQSKNNDSLKSQIKKWVDDRMMDDIDSSPFTFSHVCYDTSTGEKIVKEASTPAEKSAPICWALDLLTKSKPKESALVALGFHEFIHHFNEADRDHTLAAQFKTFYLEANTQSMSTATKSTAKKTILMDVSYSCEINHPETTQKLTKLEIYSDDTMVEKTIKTFAHSPEPQQPNECFKMQAALEKKEAQRKMNIDFTVGERELYFLEYECRYVKWLNSDGDSKQVLFKMTHYEFNGENSISLKSFGPHTSELGAYPVEGNGIDPSCDSRRQSLAQAETLRLKAFGRSTPHIMTIEEKWAADKKSRLEQEALEKQTQENGERFITDITYKCRASSKTEEQLFETVIYNDRSSHTGALGVFPSSKFDTFLRQSCEERRAELEVLEAQRKKNEQRQYPNRQYSGVTFKCVYADKTKERLIKIIYFSDGSSRKIELGTYPNDDFDTFLSSSCSEKRRQSERNSISKY